METKEVELAKREEELSTKIRLLENQKNILIKESKSLENEAKKRKAEYDIEEKKFMKLAVEETKELEKLDAEINLEHNRETETLVQMLSDEATSIMQQFKSQGSNSSTEIALDAESVEHQLQSMTKASMDILEIISVVKMTPVEGAIETVTIGPPLLSSS